MSVYNPNDPRDYLAIIRTIEKAKECHYKLEITKFHPVQTDSQQRFIHFMISYFAFKTGDTFFSVLRNLQMHVAPVPFYTGQKDAQGNDKFRPISSLTTAEASSVIRNFLDFAISSGVPIPEQDDRISIDYCKRELESSSGWV